MTQNMENITKNVQEIREANLPSRSFTQRRSSVPLPRSLNSAVGRVEGRDSSSRS